MKQYDKLVYWIEETNNRFYVYYWKSNQGIVKTLFDVCHSKQDAEKAIEDHKQGRHGTQWEPK